MKDLIATHNSPVVLRLRPFLRTTVLSESVKERVQKHFDSLDLRSEPAVEEWLGTVFSSTRYYACALIHEFEPFDPYTTAPDEWAKQFEVVHADEARNWVEEATVLFVSRMIDALPEIVLDHPDFLKLPARLAVYLTPLLHEIYPQTRETLVKAMVTHAQHYGKTSDGRSLQENLWPLNQNSTIDGEPVYVLR